MESNKFIAAASRVFSGLIRSGDVMMPKTLLQKINKDGLVAKLSDLSSLLDILISLGAIKKKRNGAIEVYDQNILERCLGDLFNLFEGRQIAGNEFAGTGWNTIPFGNPTNECFDKLYIEIRGGRVDEIVDILSMALKELIQGGMRKVVIIKVSETSPEWTTVWNIFKPAFAKLKKQDGFTLSVFEFNKVIQCSCGKRATTHIFDSWNRNKIPACQDCADRIRI